MASNSVPAILKPSGGLPWVPSLIVFAVAAALSFTFHLPEQASVKHALQFGHSKAPATPVSMRIEEQGDRILLSWNRDNAAIRSASGGVLHIDDGSQHRKVQLDPGVLATGSVLYRPESDDVSFQLEIRGQQGELISGSLRLLDGTTTSRSTFTHGPDLKSSIPNRSPITAATVVTVTAPQYRNKQILMPAKESHQFHAPAISIGKPLPSVLSAPPHTQASVPGNTGTLPLQVSEQAEAQAPVTSSKLIAQSTSPQVLTTTPASPDIIAPPDTTRQLQVSKVSNQADALSDKAVQSAQPPAVPLTSPESSSMTTKADDLMAATVVPCRPIRQVMPDLRRLGIANTVTRSLQLEVAVRVNVKGNVTEAHLVGERRSVPAYIAFAALDAAKQWTFRPATLRGQNVASDHTIVFKFGSDRR